MSKFLCPICFRFTKLDLFTPAVRRGLPITQVICRMELQDILINAVGSEIVRNKSKVVDFMEDSNKVLKCFNNLNSNKPISVCISLPFHRLLGNSYTSRWTAVWWRYISWSWWNLVNSMLSSPSLSFNSSVIFLLPHF